MGGGSGQGTRGEGGHNALTVSNNGQQDAVVKLVPRAEPREVLQLVYIRAGDTWRLTGIQPGSYVLQFSLGMNWSGLRFAEPTYLEFADAFTFTETDQGVVGDYRQYGLRNWQVTLYAVPGGNAPTKDIDERTFFEGIGAKGEVE